MTISWSLSRLSSFALSIFPREIVRSHAEYHVKLRAFSTPAFDQSVWVWQSSPPGAIEGDNRPTYRGHHQQINHVVTAPLGKANWDPGEFFQRPTCYMTLALLVCLSNSLSSTSPRNASSREAVQRLTPARVKFYFAVLRGVAQRNFARVTAWKHTFTRKRAREERETAHISRAITRTFPPGWL